MILACAALAACRDLTIDPNRVIAIEVTTPRPRVVEGDTLRLQARALNGAGGVVSGAAVTWAVADTGAGFTLNETSGLVTALRAGVWRALVCLESCAPGSLRSDPITVTVTPRPSPVTWVIAVRATPPRFVGPFPNQATR